MPIRRRPSPVLRPLAATLLVLALFPPEGTAQTREYIYMGGRLLAIQGPVVTVQFAAPGSGPTEAEDATVAVTVSVPGGLHPGVSFYYKLLSGTAVAGQDFMGVHGELVRVDVAENQGTATIPVDIVNDTLFEDNESFTIVLSDPSGAVLGPQTTHQVTILDDEPTVELVQGSSTVNEGPGASASVDVRLSLRNGIARSSSPVDFSFATTDDTAQAPEDYIASSGPRSFPAGTPQGEVQRILVTVVNDEIDEPDQHFHLDLTAVTGGALGLSRHTVTIADEDPTPLLSIADVGVTEGETGSALASLAVTLSRPSQYPVRVTYQTASGTALDAGRDFWPRGPALLDFPFGATVLDARVPVVGDRVAEPAESFFVNLSGAQNAILLDSQGVVSIADTDAAGFAVNHVSTAEGADAAIMVTLPAAPAGAVTVNYETVPGTATPGVDYEPVTGTLTIIPPASAAKLNIRTFADGAWENRETFVVRLSGSSGPAIAYPEATVTVVDPHAGSDFNGDRRTDLLWRRDAVGQVALWYMAGAQQSGGSFTNPSTQPLNWRVAGTGAFPPTPGWDLLWWDEATGNLQVWQMQEANRVGVQTTNPAGLTDTRWTPVATGDFNADGHTDIVWRHTSSGEIVIWLMNGRNLQGGGFTTPRQMPLAWQIQGAGDFNADGKSDLVWRHVGSGQLVVWFMNGTVQSGGTFMDPEALAAAEWQLRVVRDFDLDGQPDLLWRHSISGQNVVWWMDGFILEVGEFATPLTETIWKLEGPR